MPSVMKDLSSSTFCVPAIYKHPPLAYSMVNKIHWHSDAAKHSCVESVLRYVLKLGYIMQGRDLVKKLKKNCKRWRDTLERKQSILKLVQFHLSIEEQHQHFMLLKLPFVDHSKHILSITKEQQSKFGYLSIAAGLLQPH